MGHGEVISDFGFRISDLKILSSALRVIFFVPFVVKPLEVKDAENP